MTELLPCSKCRRVPVVGSVNQPPWGVTWRASCGCPGATHDCDRERLERRWNRFCGAPLTLAERPQDVPALDVDEGSVGEGVRVVQPSGPATCDGVGMRRWRTCGDLLARWSVMACSGGG